MVKILAEDPTIVIDFDVTYDRSRLLGDQPPRQQVRGMLRVGQKDLIAPTKQRSRPGGGHQIDALGAAASPDNLFRLGRIDELRDSLTRALIALKCTSRQGVQRRARVGIVMPIEILDRI